MAGGPEPHGIWQISKPYSNQGADYAPQTTASPPGFKNLSTPLDIKYLPYAHMHRTALFGTLKQKTSSVKLLKCQR